MNRKNYQAWSHELRYCRAAGGDEVRVTYGHESERVPVRDVLTRRRFFSYPGVYIIRDGETVVYVGSTRTPLGVRLRNAVYVKAKWTTSENFDSLTVSMIARDGDEEADAALEAKLIAEYRPRFCRKGVVMASQYGHGAQA
jgi:hypothetical protein